jgi:hypothetical protein
MREFRGLRKEKKVSVLVPTKCFFRGSQIDFDSCCPRRPIFSYEEVEKAPRMIFFHVQLRLASQRGRGKKEHLVNVIN